MHPSGVRSVSRRGVLRGGVRVDVVIGACPGNGVVSRW